MIYCCQGMPSTTTLNEPFLNKEVEYEIMYTYTILQMCFPTQTFFAAHPLLILTNIQ